MTTRTALTKARRGAAFLDEKLGRGWRRKIRRRDLDMASFYYSGKGTCGCIVSQLYTAYCDGVDALGIDIAQQRRLGFEVDDREEYEDLTEAWLEVLRGKA